MAKQANAPGEPVDLAKFDAAVQRQEEGILVPIYGMDGKTRLGFSIRVAGPDSSRSTEALDTIQQELIEEASLDAPKPSDNAHRRLRYFAKVTMDFVPDEREDGTRPDHAIVLDGEPLPFSEENAAKLYQRFRFIYQQVVAKADTRAAFLKD
jgi:hypothetical protein